MTPQRPFDPTLLDNRVAIGPSRPSRLPMLSGSFDLTRRVQEGSRVAPPPFDPREARPAAEVPGRGPAPFPRGGAS